MNTKPIIVCIAGASGSGKTTFARQIQKQLPNDESIIITQDSYYRDLGHLSASERQKQNFDHPHSLNFEKLKKDLIDLKNGRSIEQPIYDFNTHSTISQKTTITPKKTILVEGTLTLSQLDLLNLFDYKIYINTPQNVCLERRIKRDVLERGRTEKSVIQQYNNTVKPMFDQFISPSKIHADITILGTYLQDYTQQISTEIIKIINNSQ